MEFHSSGRCRRHPLRGALIIKRLHKAEDWLWYGRVEAAFAEFEHLKSKKARNFQAYLLKHGQRIPNYHQYQQLDIPIGSGDVEPLN